MYCLVLHPQWLFYTFIFCWSNPYGYSNLKKKYPRRDRVVLKSGYSLGEAYGNLRKCWLGYKIAKNDGDEEKMIHTMQRVFKSFRIIKTRCHKGYCLQWIIIVISYYNSASSNRNWLWIIKFRVCWRWRTENNIDDWEWWRHLVWCQFFVFAILIVSWQILSFLIIGYFYFAPIMISLPLACSAISSFLDCFESANYNLGRTKLVRNR